MRQTNEVCAHVTNELQLFAHQIVTHGSSHAGMIRMTLSSAQEYPFAVQLERTVLNKIELAYTKALVEMHLAGRTGKRHPATIEVG
jgi:hypothetical protein